MNQEWQWKYGHGPYGTAATLILVVWVFLGWFLGPHLQFLNGWGIIVDLVNGLFGPTLPPPGPRYIAGQAALGAWALPLAVLILFTFPVIISIPLVEFWLRRSKDPPKGGDGT